MHTPTLACVALVLGFGTARGQEPWREPVSAPWPLADVAFQRGADGMITMLAYPNPVTAQSDTSNTFLAFHIAPVHLRAWLPRARQFTDSVLHGPRDIKDRPAGLGLITDDGGGRVTLAHDPNARPGGRFLLVLNPAPPAHGWSARGGPEDAQRFLEALDSILSQTTEVIQPDSVLPPFDCQGSLPKVTAYPRLDVASRWRLGGRLILEFVVDTAGMPEPETVFVLLSSGPEYTRAVQRHFNELRYSPAICNGQPTRLRVRVEISWQTTKR